MDLLIVVLIGIGLAMDCFAVALARGAQPGIDKTRQALVFAIVFGVFQTGMTVIGWAGGSLFMGHYCPLGSLGCLHYSVSDRAEDDTGRMQG